MPYGLSRKIRIAFIVQAAMASLAILLSVYVIAVVLKQGLLNGVLKEEARHYWSLYEASPAQPPPNTYNLRGYLVLRGRSDLVLPENLRDLKPGFHELAADDLMVLVDEHTEGRLYLVFLRSHAERLTFWFGTVPVVVGLVAIFFVSWVTYKLSKRLLSPLGWLAGQVSRWDPRHPDTGSLSPDRLPKEVQGETRALAMALHGLGERVAAHIARERNFTRDASHELRTPLTVIRVASDLALSEDNTPRVDRSLQRIQRAGRDMEAVIEAFLILAREAEIEPQSEDFGVVELVEYEADAARALLIEKPVELFVHAHAQPRLYAPSRVMHVLVSNLMRNACNYTDEGRIDVFVEQDRIVVSDSGIGMSAEALERAFEPFYRADESRPHGTGLGLSIVRRLCDRFGWEIELASELGKGTQATIRFA